MKLLSNSKNLLVSLFRGTKAAFWTTQSLNCEGENRGHHFGPKCNRLSPLSRQKTAHSLWRNSFISWFFQLNFRPKRWLPYGVWLTPYVLCESLLTAAERFLAGGCSLITSLIKLYGHTANNFGLMYSWKRISQNSFPNFIYIIPKTFMIFCQELGNPNRNYENQIWP